MYRSVFRFLGISAFATAAVGVKFVPLSEKPGLIDNGTHGPEIEVVHLFFGEAPIGITVAPSGRAFVTFNR